MQTPLPVANPTTLVGQSQTAAAALSCAALLVGGLLLSDQNVQPADDGSLLLAPVRAAAVPVVDSTTVAAEAVTHPTHWLGSPPLSRADLPATIVTWDTVRRVRLALWGGLYGP